MFVLYLGEFYPLTLILPKAVSPGANWKIITLLPTSNIYDKIGKKTLLLIVAGDFESGILIARNGLALTFVGNNLTDLPLSCVKFGEIRLYLCTLRSGIGARVFGNNYLRSMQGKILLYLRFRASRNRNKMEVYEATLRNRGKGSEKKEEENDNNKKEHKEEQTLGMIKPAHFSFASSLFVSIKFCPYIVSSQRQE
jgi:hypothetical protein